MFNKNGFFHNFLSMLGGFATSYVVSVVLPPAQSFADNGVTGGAAQFLQAHAYLAPVYLSAQLYLKDLLAHLTSQGPSVGAAQVAPGTIVPPTSTH